MNPKNFLVLAVASMLVLSACDSPDLTTMESDLDGVATISTSLGKVEVELTEGDLVDGQHMIVGTVAVTGDGTNLTVDIQVSDLSFCITQAHIYVGSREPSKQAPGRFNFNNDAVGCEISFTRVIPYADIPNGNGQDPGALVYIAVHTDLDAVGGPADLQRLADWLPEPGAVKFTVLSTELGVNAYFEEVKVENGSLKGVYPAWCADNDMSIAIGGATTYKADPYLVPFETLPPGVIDDPDELDKVLWLLNNYAVGDAVDTLGDLTFCDIQNAIWRLADIDPPNDNSGTSPCVVDGPRRDFLLNAANTYGDGFVPGCGDLIGILLIPTDVHKEASIATGGAIAQSVLILHRVACDGETAWGYGSLGRVVTDPDGTPLDAPVQFDEGWGWYYDFFLP
jgi:hypothetical protein